ncbi:hematopoietic SH2 domain-containing protein isoform X2 [Microcebus murinus]|uniref:hematopoietic SH2 domain-containing protein isoform X2 n=1 Tax=Microcebus murinus TaxID=30608 RepID=UPI003F6B56FE
MASHGSVPRARRGGRAPVLGSPCVPREPHTVGAGESQLGAGPERGAPQLRPGWGGWWGGSQGDGPARRTCGGNRNPERGGAAAPPARCRRADPESKPRLPQAAQPEPGARARAPRDAEHLLRPQPPGAFLIRVSHSHVGYTLSYKAQDCCRHFMVKLLDDGSLVMPGETAAHASLADLVTFHQQQPIALHGELLTQPCGQNDPENVDYEDLFLYSYTLAEEAASPSRDPREHQTSSSCLEASPEEARPLIDEQSVAASALHTAAEASPKPAPPGRPKDSKPSAGADGAPTADGPSSCPTKAPLGDAWEKLWRNLKTLPQRGRRVQQRLRAQLRKTKRSVSWDQAAPGDGSWCQAAARALSCPAARPEWRGVGEPQEDQLPEEYRPPPPFAPGYC